jgi:AP-3 complex subunit delta-1
MSLLYECINGIIQGGILDGEDNLQERDEVASLCVGKLRGMIVIDSDPNRECSHPHTPLLQLLDILSFS